MPRLRVRHRMRVALLALVALATVGFVSVSFTRAQSQQGNSAQSAAEELLTSLTPEQRAALAASLAGYKDRLDSIAKDVAAVQPDANNGRNRVFLPRVIASGSAKAIVTGLQEAPTPQADRVDPDSVALVAALDKANGSVLDVQGAIEADLARILTPEQMTLYHTALSTAPVTQQQSAPSRAAAQNSAVDTARVIDPALCFNAAQWSDYGLAYSKVAKSFALINAFIFPYGTRTDTALQSYISYNEAESYGLDGLQNLSTASVLFSADSLLVQNVNGGTLFGVKGDNDIKIAEARNDLARTLALNDYIASGGIIVNGIAFGGNTVAYLAYAYGNNADFFLDGTVVRTQFCF